MSVMVYLHAIKLARITNVHSKMIVMQTTKVVLMFPFPPSCMLRNEGNR